MNTLSNKRILFISNNYFGYYKHIVSSLFQRGACVDWFSEVPTGTYNRIKGVLLGNSHASYDSYYEGIINQLADHYDYILIIKGDLTPQFFLEHLKSKYSGAQFIMYHWDDIDLFPCVVEKFKYFDRILSYNILDCQKYNLILRPVFYVPMQCVDGKKTIDVSIVGSYNTVRGKFIKQFNQLNPEITLYSHYYINPLVFLTERLDWSSRKEFKFHKLSYNDMMCLVARSKACLDVPHSNQQGLTTRSIEALPFQTKIITTNPNIKLYDYYSANNHFIVDLKQPVVDKGWLDEPYEAVDDEIVQKYSIEHWVNDVFELND